MRSHLNSANSDCFRMLWSCAIGHLYLYATTYWSKIEYGMNFTQLHSSNIERVVANIGLGMLGPCGGTARQRAAPVGIGG